VYVSYYYKDILMDWGNARLEYWKEQIAAGKTVIVVDYDGPKMVKWFIPDPVRNSPWIF
jgi:hypothetical protein